MTPAVKMIIVGRRKPGTTLAEHRHHIRAVHGERVLRYVATEPDNAPRRYVQHEVFDGEYTAAAPGTDPFALNRDFVTQVWFPDMSALARSRETAYYREHLQGDEDRFVDQATVVFTPTHARTLHERPAPAGGAPCKLFFLLPAAADAGAFGRGWANAAARLADTDGGADCFGHVQNDALAPPPGRPAVLQGIDEFWLADEAAARRLLRGWHAVLDATLGAHGLLGRGAIALLAHEAVLHPGAIA